jgi:V/A-type H+-transporting ATPase subunit I
MEEELRNINDRAAELRPFAALGIPLEYYKGFKSISVFTGTIEDKTKLEKNLPKLTDEWEIFIPSDGSGYFALFVSNECRETVLKLLSECGYGELKVPQENGDPSMLLKQDAEKRADLTDRLKKAGDELLALRKKHADFILASEEYLSIEVQKAEAPIRFATTRHSFIIDAWVPGKDVVKLKSALDDGTDGSLYVEDFDAGHHEEPPTLLDNPKPVKPFEFLLGIYSTPTYREVDPSFILALIFPLFFGFMIGDLGYGILLIITGAVFMKKFRDNDGLFSIGWFIIIAGIFASVFGVLLFGDMFGLSFMPPPHHASGTGAEYSWSYLTGIDISLPSRIHKIETSGVTQLLLISIIAGFLHISLGLIFGIVNERKHDKRHALGKLGLLLVTTALAFLILVMGDGTLNRWLQPAKHSPIGPFLWDWVVHPLKSGFHFSGLLVPYSSLALIIAGIAILLGSVGGFGILEVLEITGHLISYTRLAAICVAKGAMAFAFNTLGLGLILSGNVFFGILGVVVIIIMQLLVFILGSLSSGIQAIRLHYVEFFMKFYKGGGVQFTPFGYRRRYTTD